MNKRFANLDEFWPFYLAQHLNRTNRRLHLAGTTLGALLLADAARRRSWWLLAAAPAVAYGLAWIGHFVCERNTPATFQYPLLSLRGDLRMYRLALTSQLDAEILRLTAALRRYRAG